MTAAIEQDSWWRTRTVSEARALFGVIWALYVFTLPIRANGAQVATALFPSLVFLAAAFAVPPIWTRFAEAR